MAKFRDSNLIVFKLHGCGMAGQWGTLGEIAPPRAAEAVDCASFPASAYAPPQVGIDAGGHWACGLGTQSMGNLEGYSWQNF